MKKADFFKNILPGLALWFRLPALISWMAVSAAIIVFKKIDPAIFCTTVFSLYYLIVTVATFSLISAILTRNFPVRFCGFFLFAVLMLSQREKIQNSVSSLFVNNKKLTTRMSATAISNPAPINGAYSFLAKCNQCSFDSTALLKGKIIQCLSTCVPPVNCSLELFGTCSEPKKPKTYYDFDEYSNFAANRIYVKMAVDSMIVTDKNKQLSAAQILHERVLRVLDRFSNPVHSAILRAAFLGEKEYLDTTTKTYFRNSGIYHLLAISGLHAGMLIAASYIFLSLFPLGSMYKHFSVLVILWSYQLFIGFIPSLFRATTMSSFIIISLLFQKKNYAMQSLGFAGTCWLLFSPESLFLPGYQLSFGATAGIITLYPILNHLRPKSPEYPVLEFLLNTFFSAFNVSLAGFLSTVPILLYHFGSVSFFGLVANLAAVTLMTYCMWIFFLSLILEPVSIFAGVLSRISAQLLDWLIWVSKSVEYAPWSQLSLRITSPALLLLYVLFLISIVVIHKKYLKQWLLWSTPVFLAVPAIFFLITSNKNELTIEQFSSDAAKATAFIWPNKDIWLLCNGTEKDYRNLINSSIKSWLRFKNKVSIENVILKSSVRRGYLQLLKPEIITQSGGGNHQNNEFLYSVVVSTTNGNSMLLTVKDRWILCNDTDSIIKTGHLQETDTIQMACPAVISLNDSR